MDNSYRVKRDASIFPQMQQCMSYFHKKFFRNTEGLNVWIAGGALKSYLESGHIEDTDVDFYSSSRQELTKLVLILRKEYKFKHYLITKNAIKGTGYIKGKKVDIDIVKRLFKDMHETIDNFDFTVTCFATNGKDFVYHPSAPFDLLRKRLVINNLPFPLSTLQRMQKYIKRGYWICNGGMLEIAKAQSEIDWENKDENTIEFYPDGSPRFVRFD